MGGNLAMNKLYSDWRRSEAYAVPMTEDGLNIAEWRYQGFEQGYIAGVQRSAFEMERLHKENKHIHKFYLLAKEELDKLRVEVRGEINNE